MHKAWWVVAYVILAVLWGGNQLPTNAAEPNLNDIPADLSVPAVTHDVPQAGKRVWQKLPGYEDWKVAHAIYLPTDWKPGGTYPVIFEYPGNGNYRNALGDKSDGRVEDCQMGYGLSEGKGMIWVSLPFVDPKTRDHAITWWGDADATAKYCLEAAAYVCKEFGGDSKRLILAGFSRGAIAGNYIGLRNEEIAKLWKGFVLHSHYDGVRRWNYAGDDEASAKVRLLRLANRPQFFSHEKSVADTENYLQRAGFQGQITLRPLPYPNHSSGWLLKETELRTEARKWLAGVLKE